LDVKIFPLSELILLPLAPTIARTIADYLLSISEQPYINTLQNNGDRVVTELPQDLSWQWQCQKSIRQISTLRYQYVSTIAHQLAAKSVVTPVAICKDLQPPFPAQTVDRSQYMELCCWYNEAGYIYFQLTPDAISTWLNYIHNLPLDRLDPDFNSQSNASIDLAIYAHARCCSLLKLADAEKLVTITASWQLTTPNSSIYVTAPQGRLTPESNCIFEHPAEQRLIEVLMEVLDGIYGDNWLLESFGSQSKAQIVSGSFPPHRKSPNWHKLTIDLAQSWLEFHRYCQIFGDIKRQNPRLAIARCGLTSISRRYLHVLLENYLGVKALGFKL
jgi:hypothetical protein